MYDVCLKSLKDPMVSLILVMSYDLRLGFNGAKFVQNAPGSFFFVILRACHGSTCTRRSNGLIRRVYEEVCKRVSCAGRVHPSCTPPWSMQEFSYRKAEKMKKTL